MKKKEKGFTLIELIAVLVIMAILALIVTPLVMSIIRKAKVSADKRSIDAYGRSIELAIAGYLLDNGTFPTSIDQLTIEYSGDEVVCSTTQLNSDSSVYLTDCKVGGRSIDYAYGTDNSPSYQAYSIGDEVTYNNVNYRVIKTSGAKEEMVTLLKSEPLTVAEVNEYGAGHINNYTPYSVNTTVDKGGYGGIAYYSSATCGYIYNSSDYSGCITNYTDSDIKYIVDAWKNANALDAIEARLIQYDEFENLGYEWATIDYSGTQGWKKTEQTPSWLYSSIYNYWTSTLVTNNNKNAWVVQINGYVDRATIYDTALGVVRPVIVLSKSELSN